MTHQRRADHFEFAIASPRLLFGISLLVLTLFLWSFPKDARAQRSSAGGKGVEITVIQVLCEKKGEPSLPKNLERYAKDLKKTGYNRFFVSKKKKHTLQKGTPQKFPLSARLGDALLTLTEKGRIELKVVQRKKVTEIGAKLGKHPLMHPLILTDPSLKTRDGKQLILILEPRKKKPK